jgi:hypothetical protein
MLRLVADYSSEPVGFMVTKQPVIRGSKYATTGSAGNILWLTVSWTGPGDDANLKAALDQALERASDSVACGSGQRVRQPEGREVVGADEGGELGDLLAAQGHHRD